MTKVKVYTTHTTEKEIDVDYPRNPYLYINKKYYEL